MFMIVGVIGRSIAVRMIIIDVAIVICVVFFRHCEVVLWVFGAVVRVVV